MMIDRYRASAHQFADTDPLKLDWHEKMHGKLDKSIFNLEEFGFTKDNLKDEIVLKYLRDDDPNRINGPYTIEAMQKYLEKTYMNKVGYEYMYLGSKMERDFIKASIEKNIETLMVSEPSKEERLATFKRLCKDQSFIDFLIAKFANYKRFGIEGLNAVTSALGKLVETASESDC
jgi:2-oxoglutarate dehydrogenase complex dehydrogenase (E1) component-like enzyme